MAEIRVCSYVVVQCLVCEIFSKYYDMQSGHSFTIDIKDITIF